MSDSKIIYSSIGFQVIALVIAALTGGGGHGPMYGTRIFFPYFPLGAMLSQSDFLPLALIGIPMVLVALPLWFIQYPVYGLIVIWARHREKDMSKKAAKYAIARNVVIACHCTAAALALVFGFGPEH